MASITIDIKPNEDNWAGFCKAWEEHKLATEKIMDANRKRRVEAMEGDLKSLPSDVVKTIMELHQKSYLEDTEIFRAQSQNLQKLSRLLFETSTKDVSDTINEVLASCLREDSKQYVSPHGRYILQTPPSCLGSQHYMQAPCPPAFTANASPLKRPCPFTEIRTEPNILPDTKVLRIQAQHNTSFPPVFSHPYTEAYEKQTTKQLGDLLQEFNASSPIPRIPENTPVQTYQSSNAVPPPDFSVPPAFSAHAALLTPPAPPAPTKITDHSTNAQILIPRKTTMSMIPILSQITEFPARSRTRGPGKYYILLCPICNRNFDTAPGCFIHFNQSDIEHAIALGSGAKSRTHASAVKVAGVEIVDASAATVEAHNVKRRELIRAAGRGYI